jgi:hypothetical protein
MDAFVQEINFRSDSTIPAFRQHATICAVQTVKTSISARSDFRVQALFYLSCSNIVPETL